MFWLPLESMRRRGVLPITLISRRGVVPMASITRRTLQKEDMETPVYDIFAAGMRALPDDIASAIAAEGGGMTTCSICPIDGRLFRISAENPCVVYLKLSWLMHRDADLNNLQYYLGLRFVHRVVVHLCHERLWLPAEWPTLTFPPHQLTTKEQEVLEALSLVCRELACMLEIEDCCPQVDRLPRDPLGAICDRGILTDKRLCPCCSGECAYMNGDRGYVEDWDLGVEIEEGRM